MWNKNFQFLRPYQDRTVDLHHWLFENASLHIRNIIIIVMTICPHELATVVKICEWNLIFGLNKAGIYSLTYVNVWWFTYVRHADMSLTLQGNIWKRFSLRIYIYIVYKHNYYNLKKKLPEFPSPGYQFMVFFRSLWCKAKCSCSRFNFQLFWKERKTYYYQVIIKWRKSEALES
jgi:hypothetical protein